MDGPHDPKDKEAVVPPDAIDALIQDLISLQLRGDQEALLLRNIFDENEELLVALDEETSKKEELLIVVEDLSQQVASLLKEFNIAVKARDEELGIIEKGNFTSDEEDMGITPAQFDRQNSLKKEGKGKGRGK